MTSNNNLGIQKFSHLGIPTKQHYLTSITILISRAKFFDTIIYVDYWYHALTYILVQHWLQPPSNKLGLTWLVTAAFTECFLIKLWPWMNQVQVWKSNGELHTARPQLQNVYSVLELWVEHKYSLRPGQQSLRSAAVAKAEPRQALETHSHTRSAQHITIIRYWIRTC